LVILSILRQNIYKGDLCTFSINEKILENYFYLHKAATYSNKIEVLVRAFDCRFEGIRSIIKHLQMFGSPFSVDSAECQAEFQLELIGNANMMSYVM